MQLASPERSRKERKERSMRIGVLRNVTKPPIYKKQSSCWGAIKKAYKMAQDQARMK